MIKKILFLFSSLFLVTNCSNFEFDYETSDFFEYKIKQKTMFSINVDNKDIITAYLLSKIGEAGDNSDYVLSINSIGLIEAAVIEIDATASKFLIEHNLRYVLKNLAENCVIFEKNILTNNLYDAKSAGYSFGTDLAEKELSAINLHSNIDQFLGELRKYKELKCKNEG